MRFQHLVFFLLAALAYGQTSPSAAPPATPSATAAKAEQSAPAAPAAPEKAPEVKVGPEDIVITLSGFCTDTKLTGDACKTTITRAQFEKLADALQPGMTPAIRRQLANRYSMGLKMSDAAEKRGLDKGPTFEEKLNFARMQILAQELSSTLQADSLKVTDAEIEEYYKKNEASYEQATFKRIIVPHSKQIPPPAEAAKPGDKAYVPPPPPSEAQKKAAEDAMTKLAADLRARAANGEDPDKLQTEAYAAAGLKGSVANTKLEKQRRSTLPPNHQLVMDMKPGEVSQVISDPNSGHYVYILVSKETLTMESVTPEIRKILSGQRYRDEMQAFQKGVDLNDNYFGTTKNPGMSLPPRPGPGRPVAPPEHDKDPD